MRTILPEPKNLSWYPTQAETLQRQRDQLAQAKRDAVAFSQSSETEPKVRWWNRVFLRLS